LLGYTREDIAQPFENFTTQGEIRVNEKIHRFESQPEAVTFSGSVVYPNARSVLDW